MPENRYNFQGRGIRTTPSIQQSFKCQGFRHKAQNCTKNRNVLCVVKLILTRTVQNREKGNPNFASCRRPHVTNYTDCPACLQGSSLQATCSPKPSFPCFHSKTNFTTTSEQHVQFHRRSNCISGYKCGNPSGSTTVLFQKPA